MSGCLKIGAVHPEYPWLPQDRQPIEKGSWSSRSEVQAPGFKISRFCKCANDIAGAYFSGFQSVDVVVVYDVGLDVCRI